jgi:hypothetical protein
VSTIFIRPAEAQDAALTNLAIGASNAALNRRLVLQQPVAFTKEYRDR